jgi:hypothetical protein
MAQTMATKRREPDDWDLEYPKADAPADQTMPKRAAGLSTQNGPAMQAVFSYLLDDVPAPEPDPKKRKR